MTDYKLHFIITDLSCKNCKTRISKVKTYYVIFLNSRNDILLIITCAKKLAQRIFAGSEKWLIKSLWLTYVILGGGNVTSKMIAKCTYTYFYTALVKLAMWLFLSHFWPLLKWANFFGPLCHQQKLVCAWY